MPVDNTEELDYEEESVEVDDTSDDSDDIEESDDGEEETPKKKDSNWKKLIQKNKQLERELADAKKEQLKNKAIDLPKGMEKADWLEFTLDNPEAKELKQEILELASKGLSLDDALILAKAKTPKVSKSKSDFDLNGKPNRAKKMEDMTEEEALNLPASEFIKWERSQGTKI